MLHHKIHLTLKCFQKHLLQIVVQKRQAIQLTKRIAYLLVSFGLLWMYCEGNNGFTQRLYWITHRYFCQCTTRSWNMCLGTSSQVRMDDVSQPFYCFSNCGIYSEQQLLFGTFWLYVV